VEGLFHVGFSDGAIMDAGNCFENYLIGKKWGVKTLIYYFSKMICVLNERA